MDITATPAPTAPGTASAPRTSPAAAPREVFIDWLRIAALGLLILYHVGMAYTSWMWHVKSAAAARPGAAFAAEVAAAVEPWMRLTAPWRMTLLFLISGLATSLMLRRRAASPAGPQAAAPPGWLRERARRLLLPLLAGVVLVVPPQSYLEVQQFHGYAGSYLEFLALYFGGEGGFCTRERGCLILPTWNHLWFLPYLFVYTAVLAGLVRLRPGALDHAAARLPSWLGGAAWLLAPIAWFALTRWTLKPLFGETHALVDDLFLHAQYAAAFALGVLMARAPAAALWPRVQALRHLALALTLLAWGLLIATPPGAAWRVLPWSVMQWCAIVAALGYARRHLQRDNAWRARLSEAVFPIYVLHQTVTVLGVALLARWPLPVAAEAAILMAATFGLSWLGYEGVRRVGVLRPWFGLGSRRPRAAPIQRVEGQGAEMRTIDPRVNT